MASIVAYIELRGGAITNPSRCAVADARRVADSAGATVYALFTVGPLTQAEMDRLASEISAAGADRIFCSSSEALAGPPLDATHGALLAQVAEHLRPLLFLFPAGSVGVQLGPPLAVRLGAAYLANASIDIRREDREADLPSYRVLLSRWRAARDGQRKIDLGDLERPVVASLAAGAIPLPSGEPYAEVEMMPCPESRFPGTVPIIWEADGDAVFELCQAMVLSARPASAAASDALKSELPAGTMLAFADDAGKTHNQLATPRKVFVLPSAWDALTAGLPRLPPGALVARVGSAYGTGGNPSGKLGTEAEADADLAELAAAIGRVRNMGRRS